MKIKNRMGALAAPALRGVIWGRVCRDCGKPIKGLYCKPCNGE